MSIMRTNISAILLLVLTCIPTGLVAEQLCSSGENKVYLIELYTSQGCSSCPPAERWISRLTQHPGLWTDFVPVVFHVDYWNSLGWIDPFSRPEYSARQRNYHRAKLVSSVYTPAFFVGGKEWKHWYRGFSLPSEPVTAGELKARLDNGSLHARYSPQGPKKLTIALLSSGHSTHVTSGENKDRVLTGHFIVRQLLSSYSYTSEWTVSLPTLPAEKSIQSAIAIWVSSDYSPAPIQATGCWLNTGY